MLQLPRSSTICLDVESFSSRYCFCVQQKLEHRSSYKTGTSKVSIFTKHNVPGWFTWDWDKQKTICQSRLSGRQNFVLSTYQALIFADFIFVWCRNWNFTVRLSSTIASWKRKRCRHLLYFTRCRWFISDSDSESECQNWKKEAGLKTENQKLETLY